MKKRTDYEKLAKDDSTMFLAHSSGYLWTQGAFSIDALVSIGLDSYWLLCIFGLYHALLYLLFFSYTLTPKKKKITLISRVPICQYVGFLNFNFFFFGCLRDTRAAKL